MSGSLALWLRFKLSTTKIQVGSLTVVAAFVMERVHKVEILLFGSCASHHHYWRVFAQFDDFSEHQDWQQVGRQNFFQIIILQVQQNKTRIFCWHNDGSVKYCHQCGTCMRRWWCHQERKIQTPQTQMGAVRLCTLLLTGGTSYQKAPFPALSARGVSELIKVRRLFLCSSGLTQIEFNLYIKLQDRFSYSESRAWNMLLLIW